MSEQTVNLIISRIEEMGYKIGGEAVELLEQYYPMVQRKLIINNIALLLIGFTLFGFAIYLTKKGKNSSYYKTPLFSFAGLTYLWSGYLIYSRVVTLLNLDYYTIQTILEQLKGGL